MTQVCAGDQGMACYKGQSFKALVLAVVTGRDGPMFSVTPIDADIWHRLPASSVLVRPDEFVPHFQPRP